MTGEPGFATTLPPTAEDQAAAVLRPYPRMVRPASRLAHQLRDLGAIGLVVLFGLLAGDWIASLGLAVLFIGWKYLMREPGPPIVAAVFSVQWLQVMAAVIYLAISGRQIGEMRNVHYRPMMLIGLGCVVVLFSSFYFGAAFGRFRRYSPGRLTLLPWSTNRIATIYMATVAGSGVLQELAWSTRGLTQPLLVFSRIRYIFLYFLVTRLITQKKRWPWIAGILAAELLLGFTGFFAEFREPLVVVGIAILGTMDRKRVRTWVLVASLAALAVVSAVVWTAIKPILRANYSINVSRTERIGAALAVTGATFTTGAPLVKYYVDALVSRIWAIYFPALALERVPSVLPHENGKIIWGALQNVFVPRMFFPDKPVLPSQSDEVRKYAGVWVAGRETNTSYAFGYAAESYVDFGVPLMFLPIFIWGLLLGFAYRWLSNHLLFHELRTGVIIVVVWTTMAYYEASWVMMIGPAVMVLLLLGTGAAVLDRFIREASKRSAPPRPPGRVMPQPYRLGP